MTRLPLVVTGGAGFIGSHTAKALSRAGFTPVVYDNLSTGHQDSVRWGPFERGDLLDGERLSAVLEHYRPAAVVHFAASAYVGESVVDPAKYYRNNVVGSATLIEACRRAGVDKLVFSSSCATYGIPPALPIRESTVQVPINPYGRTKLMIEAMLADYAAAYGSKYACLRYFNACGADTEGELTERHDPETHIIPLALMAAAGTAGHLSLYGDDYDTPDGTCLRDYVHVDDLARAHVAAVEHLLAGGDSIAVNLGSGGATSIYEILKAIERITGRKVPYVINARRPGDPPALVADISLARERLAFNPMYSDIETIIRTAAPSFGLELRT